MAYIHQDYMTSTKAPTTEGSPEQKSFLLSRWMMLKRHFQAHAFQILRAATGKSNSYLKSIDIFLVTCFIMVFASLLEYACVSFLGLVKPTTTLIKAGRQQQQQQRYHLAAARQVRQSRDHLLDTPSSPWDPAAAVFITGDTRTADNGPTSQHEPSVTAARLLSVLKKTSKHRISITQAVPMTPAPDRFAS